MNDCSSNDGSIESHRAVSLALPAAVTEILARLEDGGHAAYAVGGCVRDLLMGRAPHDFDICTSAPPEAVHAVFDGARVLDTGVSHGTVTLRVDGASYEITTFRADGRYSDGRRPDSVTFVPDVERDLARRDFTVNAMAYSPRRGLADPFGGRADVAHRRIRCVGDPDARFAEDGLRILRGVRFSATLGFSVAPETAAAIHRNVQLLDRIARERVREELVRLLCGAGAQAALIDYSDVICRVIHELSACVGFEQRNPHHHLTLYAHIAETVGNAPPDPELRLALLLHDIGKPDTVTVDGNGVGHFYGHPELGARMAETVLRRLRFDNGAIRTVTTLIRYHNSPIQPEERALRRWLNRLGETRLLQLLDMQRADARAHADPARRLAAVETAREALTAAMQTRPCYTVSNLAVGGGDMLALGVPEGPAVGALLRAALDAVMDGRVENTREALLAFVRTRID